MTAFERMMAMVDANPGHGPHGECWMFKGAKQKLKKHPYGRFKWSGFTHLAHRAMWQLVNGAIPDGLSVLHRCDVPLCVRPNHLFLGTNKDNASDMVSKGRAAFQRDPLRAMLHMLLLQFRRENNPPNYDRVRGRGVYGVEHGRKVSAGMYQARFRRQQSTQRRAA